jgi:hypothetical protein
VLLFAAAAACSASAQSRSGRADQPALSHRDPLSPPSPLHSILLVGALGDVITAAFDTYGIQMVIAPSVSARGRIIQFDLKDADLASMADVLASLTGCFFVPVNTHLALAFEDNPANRLRFQRMRTETIELPDADDAADKASVEGLLTGVLGIKGAIFHDKSVTITTTPSLLNEAKVTLAKVYRPQPQVFLQIRTYLVSRKHDRDIGVDLPGEIKVFNVVSEGESLINSNTSVVQEIISEGLASSGDTLAIAALLVAGGYAGNSILGSSSLYFGGGYTTTGVQADGVTANASLTESSSQKLYDGTMQIVGDEIGKFKIGERYPVMTASTTYYGTTSATNTTTPNIQYVDLGFTLEAKAHRMADDSILLHLHQVISGLHGSSLNNIPVLDNQEFTTDLSVPNGATAVIVSNLSRTETRATQGIAASINTSSSASVDDSKLIITVTPHITRERIRATKSTTSSVEKGAVFAR